MTAPAITREHTGDLSQHPAATASPAATLSAAPGSTMTNTGEVNNAKPATSGASVHQPALYRSAYLHNPEPPYPERSRELGEQGRVILQVGSVPRAVRCKWKSSATAAAVVWTKPPGKR
jgi:protein TonB